MRIKGIITVGVICIAWSAASAITVSTEAGKLSTAVSDKNATELVVNGAIDARDIRFIADEMGALEVLDLSGAHIEALTSDVAYFGDKYAYSANELPELCFFGKGYKAVTLPATLRTIGRGAMAGCTKMEAIKIPETVDSIGDFACSGCEVAASIALGSKLRAVGNYAFSRCMGLKAIDLTTLAGGVRWGRNIFADCTGLAAVTIPSTMSAIPAGMFAGCGALMEVRLGANPQLTSIGEEAFMESGLTVFDFAGCGKLSTIGRWAFAKTPLQEVKLPASVASVGEGAFFYNTVTKVVSLSSNLKAISDFAFSGDSLATAMPALGEGVTTIGKYAFSGWNGVSEMKLPASVDSIGSNAYENCSKLTFVQADAQEVPRLGDDVFLGVKQSAAKLLVPAQSADAYKAAAQWKEFNIVYVPLTVDEGTAETAIKAYFVGKMLHIESSMEMSAVWMYDAGGVLLASVSPKAVSATIPTDNFAGKLYIVRVKQNGEKEQTIKLIRK